MLTSRAAFPVLTGNANNGLRWRWSCTPLAGTSRPPSALTSDSRQSWCYPPLPSRADTLRSSPSPPGIPARAACGVAPVPGVPRGGSGPAAPRPPRPLSRSEPVTGTSSAAAPARRQQQPATGASCAALRGSQRRARPARAEQGLGCSPRSYAP